MYAQLGNIRFEGLKGFSSFSHDRGVNYAQHELINGKPKLQAVGDNLDSIIFDMYLHSEFTDPESDIDTLKTAMQNKEILTLILGNGKVVGSFVIPNLSQQTYFTDPNGNLISVNLSVELLESFSEIPLNTEKQQAINNSFATSLRNSNVRSVLPPKLSVGMTMTSEVSNIQTSATLTSVYVQKVIEKPNQAAYWSGKISKSLDEIEGSINNVQDVLSDASQLQDLAESVPDALSDVNSRVQNMKAVLPISDIESFKILNQQLSGSVISLNSANLDVSNNSVIRRI